MGKRRLTRKEASSNILLHVYKENARKRNVPWDLTKEDFRALIERPCFYCGCDPYRLSPRPSNNKRTEPGAFLYNGIDQVNPKEGYSLGNVVPCCRECNKAKDQMGIDEFKEWLCDAYNHLIGAGDG